MPVTVYDRLLFRLVYRLQAAGEKLPPKRFAQLDKIPLKNRDGRRGRRPSRTEKARHLKNLGRVRGLADRRYGVFQRNLDNVPVPIGSILQANCY